MLKQIEILKRKLRLLQDNQSAIRKYYKCITIGIKSTPKNIGNFSQKIIKKCKKRIQTERYLVVNEVEKPIRGMRMQK